MNIAILVDPHFPIPPEKYGGIERLTAYLITGLQALGHTVTLFGPGDSTIDCRLIACSKKHIDIGFDTHSLKKFYAAKERNITNLIRMQDEFDVINWHAHFDKKMRHIRKPILFTLENPLPFSMTNSEINVLQTMKHIYMNAISKKYMRVHHEIPYITYIYNGLPVDAFAFSPKTKGYISYIGRFAKVKQPHLAMKAAITLNKKLVIGARLDRFGRDYFEKYCKHYMDNPLIDFRGEVTDEEKKDIFRFAEVNVHPVAFDEPFGLAVVEAGLCGTPTIAFDKGSMRELIKDGISGYVAKNFNELVAVYPKAVKLDRKKVREHFMQFNQKAMAQKYADTFERLIENAQ